MRIKTKKGVVILLITSVGFLVASLLLMQYQIKPKNIGDIEYDIIKLGNQGQSQMFYIDKAAEYSLNQALDTKSRNYKSSEKTYTNREVCKLQLGVCKENKPDCEINMKVLCEEETLKSFKTEMGKYIQILNSETGNDLNINDYSIRIKIEGTKVEAQGITTNTLKAKKGDVEYKIKPNFRIKTEL